MLANLKQYQNVLASKSPRRRELLAGLDIDYEVRVLPGIDESYPAGLAAEEIPQYISREKAGAYEAVMQPDDLIITADTIVWADGQVLGKPKDEAEAREMLRKQVRSRFTGKEPVLNYVAQPPLEGGLVMEVHSYSLDKNDKISYKSYEGTAYVLVENANGRFLFSGPFLFSGHWFFP